MIQKIASILVTASVLLSSITAFAANMTDTAFTADNLATGACIMAVYDAEGRLTACGQGTVSKTDTGYKATTDIVLPEGEGFTQKIIMIESEQVIKLDDAVNQPSATMVPTTTPTGSPAPTASPAVSASPIPTATPAVTAKPSIPPIYNREIDAVNAFAVVNKVNIAADKSDDLKYAISVFYQGRETEFLVKEDMTVASAPSIYSELEGMKVSALKKGDIITIDTKVSGEIRTVHLVYRPINNDIMLQDEDYGTSFEQLISKNGAVGGNSAWKVYPYGKQTSNADTQYAFGLVKNKTADSLVLYNKGGKEEDAIYLSLSKNTIVYTCDMSDKKDLQIGDIADIQKSELPKSYFDADSNVVEWTDEYANHYVLARVVDGIVTDIIVYMNYNI